ncbi:MAG: helix-turn-helix domain-containing protein [Nitrosospira sp.]|nr:helix-turn-helix domain-containing protein [Nitrosospira sp.]
MTKGPILQKIWDNLPSDRKARIEARTDELEREYLTLQELRKKAGLTQAGVSQELGMPQSNVSRLEKGSDMLLSTLRQYVEAIGGRLNLTVELPDAPPIKLEVLSDLVDRQSIIKSSRNNPQKVIQK